MTTTDSSLLRVASHPHTHAGPTYSVLRVSSLSPSSVTFHFTFQPRRSSSPLSTGCSPRTTPSVEVLTSRHYSHHRPQRRPGLPVIGRTINPYALGHEPISASHQPTRYYSVSPILSYGDRVEPGPTIDFAHRLMRPQTLPLHRARLTVPPCRRRLGRQ